MPVTPPPIRTVDTLELPHYTSFRLANGMEAYSLSGGSEPVLKLELVFRAGAVFEKKTAIAEVMAALMTEGTRMLSSAELAEKVESLGATLQTRGGVDTVRVRLYTLTRFFPQLLDLLLDVLQSPAFDEKELALYVNNKIERLNIDLKKNEFLAYRYLTEVIYGPSHPYGKNTMPEDYRALGTEELRAHHQHFIRPERGMVFLSGSFGEPELRLLDNVLGQWRLRGSNGIDTAPDNKIISTSGYFEYDGPQTHQAAIRIGRPLFTQHHPDFNGVFVLNTLLGGYFGSRLMKEVRENQGLTYGIYSSVDTFGEAGCFYISTEATTQNKDKVVEAIRMEANKLREELVPDEELRMACNYLMGHMMTQIDGPFSSMDFIRSMKIERLEDSSFSHLISAIREITPEQLRTLAGKYLDLEKWATVVVR